MKTKIITICASASHYRQVIEIEEQLRARGFTVHIPNTAHVMKESGDFDVSHYKTWYKDAADYHKKTKLMTDHFEKILAADAILVTNFEKHGMDGYIGGNVLMEMTVAFLNQKKIYILNPISKDLSIAEEIYGLQPIFLNGELERIH